MSDWKIQPVCKTCFYRRKLLERGYATDNWQNSYCAYNTFENKLRGCSPEGNKCDCYKPREKQPQKRMESMVK